jgi:hypothetical protein
MKIVIRYLVIVTLFSVTGDTYGQERDLLSILMAEHYENSIRHKWSASNDM